MPTSMTWGRLLLFTATVLAAASVLVNAPTAGAAVRHVSPAGEDNGRCAADACRSVDYAQSRAAVGDVVELAGGEYGAQEITASAGGRGVEYRAAAGETVVFDELKVSTSDVTIRDVTARKVDVSGRGAISNVALINVRSTKLYMRDVHGLTVRGGAYGDTVDEPTVLIDPNPASTAVTFNGVDFHDATLSPGSSAHMECIWAGGVQNFTVRNSIFRNCAYFDIFFTRLNGPDPKDVVLENNVFEASKQPSGANAPYAINIANWVSKVENFTIRNNTFGGDITIQPSSVSNVVVSGNIGPNGSCTPDVQYVENVWEGRTCDSSDRHVKDALAQFVDPRNHDWHLKPSSVAINLLRTASAPATDREGKGRRGAPDAGAHEWGVPDRRTPSSGRRGARGALRAHLTSARVCRRPRRGCPGSTKLRVQTPTPRRVAVRLRTRTGKRLRTARRMSRLMRSQRTAFRVRARSLRAGRYRVVITARDANGRVVATRRVGLRVL